MTIQPLATFARLQRLARHLDGLADTQADMMATNGSTVNNSVCEGRIEAYQYAANELRRILGDGVAEETGTGD